MKKITDDKLFYVIAVAIYVVGTFFKLMDNPIADIIIYWGFSAYLLLIGIRLNR